MKSFNFQIEPTTVPKVKTSFRNINTPIPALGTKNFINRLNKVESRSMHGQIPIVWAKAKDFNIFDIGGNCFIDFTSTIFVANVGHSNNSITNAIASVLDKPLYSCYAYANELRANYLEELIKFAKGNFEKAFLLSAGTEATEAVLKLMRMNAVRLKKRKRGIICIEGNWHGRTMGAQMMSGNKSQKEWIGFDDKDIHHIAFPYPWAMKGLSPKEFLKRELLKLNSKGIILEKDICGFMLETFQGWGAIFYPIEFVKEIEILCKENNILLAFDEMQSGFGRTGKSFGFEHYEVLPDLIACGKGMGGGVPLSGVIGRSEIMDLPEIGNMSSTHSANPLVCAAGLAVLNELKDKNLIEETAYKGGILLNHLEKLKLDFSDNITYVFCKGLIAAIHFKSSVNEMDDNFFTSKITEKCYQKGLLVVHTGRESIKIGPPLTISIDAIKEGIEVISESIREVISE